MSLARTSEAGYRVLYSGAGSDAQSALLWRSLFLFNVYRLVVGTLLFAAAVLWGENIIFGSQDRGLFLLTAVAYILFGVACFVTVGTRRQFNLQLNTQVAADIAFIVLLTAASGGISSGLGLLLLTTLAGAGLISRGQLTLFYAALAGIAVLLEHTYQVLTHDAPVAQYAQAGLLSAAYFAIAWLAHALAKHTLASEELAARREIDLANMEQVNALVIRDMQDGVLVADGRGVIRQANARAEQLLGPLRRQGKEVTLAGYVPALGARFEQWRRNAADATDAKPLSSTVGARFVPIGKSREVGAVIFLEDQSRIQSQARQLKLAAMGRLTANIAHEIRNPLSAISHAAELLREEPMIGDTTRRLITIIHENSQRLDGMVNNVLRLSRGDQAHRERFKVVDFLKTFVEQFTQIERINPEIFWLELTGDLEVLFDRSHLNQVMWNLCRNAVRHCRRKPESIRIHVGAVRSDTVVKLDVIDDGPGITPDVRARLFEPFFTSAAGGTGLGLYIAREVCEANGASLDHVETAKGTQFTVLCRAAASASER
ncbi:MAG TPA: PAS domain-containing sensor histidine kinase [Burkholderiales bacterium]|jgi:two-component system sensor histidine kinase PilS (NtrC family)|nr:PAS domain-containing sensor histidine kinase [Burkholderiales bacterium]